MKETDAERPARWPSTRWFKASEDIACFISAVSCNHEGGNQGAKDSQKRPEDSNSLSVASVSIYSILLRMERCSVRSYIQDREPFVRQRRNSGLEEGDSEEDQVNLISLPREYHLALRIGEYIQASSEKQGGSKTNGECNCDGA